MLYNFVLVSAIQLESVIITYIYMLSQFSHVPLFATLWVVACQAPLSVGFSRQEHWTVLPFPSPGDLPDPGIEPASLMSPALAGRFFATSATGKPLNFMYIHLFIYLYMYIYIHRHVYICVCVYIYIYIYICLPYCLMHDIFA